jgi:L-alanine-DL-glutamate epimerase-like enolase superfamily enzyme
VRAGELVSRLAELPLTVEEVAVTQLRRRLADGSERRTAVIQLKGIGVEGIGEEVTFQPDDLLADSSASWRLVCALPWAGASALGELWELLDRADLFARPPQFEVVRRYRRWAIEAAALDLALSLAGLTLPDALGSTSRALRFVASPPLRSLRALPAGVQLKIDAAQLESDLPVEIVDFKRRGDAAVVERVRGLYPGVLLEDPPVVPEGARVSWDVDVHSVADLDRLPQPAAVNVKPARIGSIPELLELYATCAARGIETYGGGQSELGPGRAQAQLLASIFHPDGPNDLAPSAYNDAVQMGPLPPSPLAVEPRRGFGLAP